MTIIFLVLVLIVNGLVFNPGLLTLITTITVLVLIVNGLVFNIGIKMGRNVLKSFSPHSKWTGVLPLSFAFPKSEIIRQRALIKNQA